MPTGEPTLGSKRAPAGRLRMPAPDRAAGFTYLGALFAVALFGLALAGAGRVWHTSAQREKEQQLLFAGNQYRHAISRYYDTSPGVPQWPRTLEDLLEDKRFVPARRYLRTLYPDPMTGAVDWTLIETADGIQGVHSRSLAQPLKQRGFRIENAPFEGARTYAQWRFDYSLPRAPPRAALRNDARVSDRSAIEAAPTVDPVRIDAPDLQ